MKKDIQACTRCCALMLSGHRWVCNQCENFQLCGKCYEDEPNQDNRERQPTNHNDKHALYPVKVNYVPDDLTGKDVISVSGDSAPAAVTTCNICHLDIAIGEVWCCETCPDYDVCNSCFQKNEGINHPHKLTNHSSMPQCDAQNQGARHRALELDIMLDLIVHSVNCRAIDRQCQYHNCSKVKGLLRHGARCSTRSAGGCVFCQKMWYLFRLHAQFCNEPICFVPRCSDLKDRFSPIELQDFSF